MFGYNPQTGFNSITGQFTSTNQRNPNFTMLTNRGYNVGSTANQEQEAPFRFPSASYQSPQNAPMYSGPSWGDQFMASPQASMGSDSPLQVGADINRYMEDQAVESPQGLFANFNPTMMGLNMLMGNQETPYAPTPQDILGLFSGKM